jgi:hypothetical protein
MKCVIPFRVDQSFGKSVVELLDAEIQRSSATFTDMYVYTDVYIGVRKSHGRSRNEECPTNTKYMPYYATDEYYE